MKLSPKDWRTLANVAALVTRMPAAGPVRAYMLGALKKAKISPQAMSVALALIDEKVPPKLKPVIELLRGLYA